ncbi:MAG TPA: autotransporter domain-containing protein [Xanthobacteraceae bacterium]|nr:autotransporter domain-containing protein [Xanthobacteraceae bacterium]
MFNNSSSGVSGGGLFSPGLFFIDSSTAANATITNNAGGTLGFGPYTFITGSLSFDLTKGTGSAGNATIINNAGGSTTFYNQSTGGTANITNNAGGTLFFVNLGGSPIDPDASTARVINNAGGQVDISQVNSGVSIGSLSGSGNVFLGSKALTLGNLNGNDTIGGVISDGGMGGGSGGQLIKVGTGDLTLTNTETYTGATTVNGGTLTVNGSIATSSGVTVNSGGTLAGTGTVSATTVNSGGTLAPGPNGNVGTLTVNGSLTFNAGSIFLVDVTPSTSSKVLVNGTASLTGTVDAVFLPGSYLTNSYTILTATGGRSGTFSNLVTSGLPAFLTANLAYDPNDVMLVTLHSNLVTTPGLTVNQTAVAASLDNSFNTGHGTLSGLSFVTPAQLPAALNALSGEGTSATQETAFGAGDLFLTTMMEQGQFWRSGTGATGATYAPLGYAPDASQAPVFKAMPVKAPFAPPEPLYRAWFAGFDGSWHLDGEAEPGSATQSHNTAGAAAGLDYQVNYNLLVGLAAGGSTSTFSVPDRATSGTLDGAHIGTYGVARWDAWYAAGALAFNAFDNRLTRTVAGVGPTEIETGAFNSDMLSGRFEVGYKQAFNGFAVTPFAAVEFAELWQAGYTESSTTLAGTPGVNGLTYSAQTVSSLPTFLGAQFDTRVVLANGTVWSPYARVSWVHEFDPTRDINASFITLPVTNFTVFGPSGARDAARIDLGSKLAIGRNIALFASFDGEFSDRSQMYAGRGGLEVTW